MEQAKSNRQGAQRLKAELEEERSTSTKLQGESVERESLLVEAQSRVAFLESEAHRSEVIEEYCYSIFGKVEVAMACKAGYDYLEAQLLAEMRSVPDRFHYPPRVDNCLEALFDIEKQGGGLNLGGSGAGDEESDEEADEGSEERSGEGGVDSAKKAGEGSAKEVSEGSAKDSWVSSPGKKKGEEAEPEVQ